MRFILLTVCFVSFISTTATSEDRAAFAVRASTLGIGGELALPVNEKLNIRVGLYGGKLSRDEVADNIQYDLKANLINAGAMVDYHPWAGIFHLSAGVFYAGNKISGDAVSGQNLEIGDRTYTPAEVGTLHGTVKANKIAPYAGIGWGKTTGGKKRVKFLFDVGVLFHGTPKADLTPDIPTDSPLNLDPAQRAEFDANLNQEIAAFQDDVAGFKLYPVISLGLGFKF